MRAPQPRPVTRRTVLAGAFGASALALLSGCDSLVKAAANSCPSDSAASGGVDWAPDVAHPVSHGINDLAKATPTTPGGPPRDMLVLYPSADTNPTDAAILELCLTPWPVVYFLHGQPPSGQPYVGYHRKWTQYAAILASSGYVVVVPNHEAQLPDSPEGYDDYIAEALADLDWVRTKWTHSKWVNSQADATVVAGHSYGALLAARIAGAHPEFAAFVSLSGGYLELNDAVAAASVSRPSFFMWAVSDFDPYENISTNVVKLWDGLTQYKYSAVFPGEHFDYLAPADRGGVPSGPCPLIGAVAAELSALFIAENMPTPSSRTKIPINLTPPQVQLSTRQKDFTTGWMGGLSAFHADPDCHLQLRWNYDAQTGNRSL